MKYHSWNDLQSFEKGKKGFAKHKKNWYENSKWDSKVDLRTVCYQTKSLTT